MDFDALAELLYPDIKKTPGYYEEHFPVRGLPEGAIVSRIGPSPTGFVHLGNLYNAIIGERLAHQSGGVFFLRIEDTDQKREVPGAVELVIEAMDYYGIRFDEGATVDGDRGDYGPYRQRQRKEIYQTFAKQLVKRGLAYPCFCSEESLESMREEQKSQKLNFGYYGSWAKCRDLSLEEVKKRLDAGEQFVLRFRSSGDEKNFVKVYDGIRGILEVQENYQDFVLLKSDGIPTYHFAHVIDDHLMRTTHVVRGEEWLPSLPMHVQLFDTFGWERPVFCHTAQLMKIDGESKRKLSKRKDPELGLEYYRNEGYSPAVMWEYLLTVLNSNFEQWRIDNPKGDINDFRFTTEKMSTSGALFDLVKLNDISRDMLCVREAQDIYDEIAEWAETWEKDFYRIFTADRDYSVAALSVGRGGEKPRKDLVNCRQAKEFLSFYYDETFRREDPYPENVPEDVLNTVVERYLETLDFSDDKTAWFEKVRVITDELGYALQPKKYKKNPELYPGSISDISNALRVAIVGRQNSPDLYEISMVLGEKRVRERLSKLF